MYIKSTLFAIVSAAALVSSTAIPEANAFNKIEARVSPGFYFCKDIGFSGECYFDASPFGNCGEQRLYHALQNSPEQSRTKDHDTDNR